MTGVEISTVKSTVKSHDPRVLSTPKNQQNPNLETFRLKKIGKKSSKSKSLLHKRHLAISVKTLNFSSKLNEFSDTVRLECREESECVTSSHA